MYEVAMSSRVEEKQDNDWGISANTPEDESLGIIEGSIYGSRKGHDFIPIMMRGAVICFLSLLAFGGYKVFYTGKNDNQNMYHLSENSDFEIALAWNGQPITSNETGRYLIPIKREFVESPNIDPMITASIELASRIDQEHIIKSTKMLSKGNIYIIEPGDTLSAIARRFGTNPEKLMQINKISNPNRIQPGMKLVLSVKAIPKG